MCDLVTLVQNTEALYVVQVFRGSGFDVCFLVCFAAERVSSLGKDWHRPCLKCEKCSKTLSAGSHAEVRHLELMHELCMNL